MTKNGNMLKEKYLFLRQKWRLRDQKQFMGCSFVTDKSIVRKKSTLLLYVMYVVVCFSLSDNLFDQKMKFYCRISALPAQQGGETGSRGPWGIFAEYWIFEVWLP